MPILSQYGHNDLAYKLLLQDTYPSWCFCIKNNATTIWERWDGWTPEHGFQDPAMNSFNHYSLGSVGRWFYQYMAGIDIEEGEIGFKKIVIKPNVGEGVDKMEAIYYSMNGKILSSWEKKKSEIIFKVIY